MTRRATIALPFAVLAAVTLAACTSTAPTPKAATDTSATSAIAAWWPTIQPDFDAVKTDLTGYAAASTQGDEPGITLACQTLQTDVARLDAKPVAPDPETAVDFSQTLHYISDAATACLGGDYVASNDAMTAAAEWVAKTTARVTQMTATS